ncbi:hypothetical protein B0H21DRAFT_317470 [Amylocystis lapponica]|nr:hypothetical protein B0H21DRAFT_317470 [Amylocystis lapponica]
MASVFVPKPGCPLCGIVSSAIHTPSHSPVLASFPDSDQPQILWRDENFTIYRERTNPVSSRGHIVIVFNLHVPSLYNLSSSDLPLLVVIRDISHRLLSSIQAPASVPFAAPSPTSATFLPSSDNNDIHIGFVTPPFRDPKLPVTDHLHAHAFVSPADRMGWFRGIAFSSLAWYAIDDLIAEIREESSNNRVRSGTARRPIDFVPHAGSRSGTADGIETTERSLAVVDLEDGESAPNSPRSPTTATGFLTGTPARIRA